jgi:flagellar hook-associated protein 3 FlgL
MRITNQMMVDSALRNLAQNETKMDSLQSQLTSGKRITRPSDDPDGARLALAYRAQQDAREQYTRTIDNSMSWVQAAQAPLDGATNLLHRARELAVQASNDTLNAGDRAAIATELDTLIGQLVQLGNTSVRGQRIFAGTQTGTDPLVLNSGPPTTVSYTGDSGQMMREIDFGVTVPINVSGSFFTGVAGTLITLRDDVQAGNTTAIQGGLTALDGSLQQVLDVQTQVGALTNRLQATRDRHALDTEHEGERLSQIEDVDYTEAVSAFTLQETVYKAALAASSHAIQPSLFDYLR